ncbi:amidase [Bordetella muralis]|uniref:amidase n=1 Tax=Bordetella muralis TaxID=1649130 RepID=UPI0039F10FB9
MANRLAEAAMPSLGLTSIPMAQALHATAQVEPSRDAVNMPTAELGWHDWWEKRAGLAARAFSVQDLANISLDRLARVNDVTMACVELLRESALDQARALDKRLASGLALGPVGGMPLAHKDLLHRTGYETGYGMAGPAAKASFDATVLRRFDEAGALHLARLHMTELAFDPSGTNEMAGHCRNPWSIDHIPGGSSSGSAAVVAAGAVDGALGSDTGGSIRIPAALCGVTGLKPTYGLVSRAGAMSLSATHDHLGPIARSARDCALMLQAIAGYDGADAGSVPAPENNHYVDGIDRSVAGLRIGVLQGGFADGVDSRIQAVMTQSLASLRSLGADIREVPEFPYDTLNEMAILMIRAEATSLYERLIRPGTDAVLGDFTRARLQEGTPIPASLYLQAMALRGPLLVQFVRTVMSDVDVLMAPVFPLPTPRVDAFDTMNAESRRLRGELTRLTRPFNYLGLPSLSLPGGTCVPDDETAALPVGFQLIGRPYSESLLLRLGHAFQKNTAWHLRMPALATL